jgi:hypothetical protein
VRPPALLIALAAILATAPRLGGPPVETSAGFDVG